MIGTLIKGESRHMYAGNLVLFSLLYNGGKCFHIVEFICTSSIHSLKVIPLPMLALQDLCSGGGTVHNAGCIFLDHTILRFDVLFPSQSGKQTYLFYNSSRSSHFLVLDFLYMWAGSSPLALSLTS